MSKITIYLIRHSEQLKNVTDFINDTDSEQIQNEKIILSVDGEKKAYELSNIEELQDIDELWSSSYVRAISTAKYIAQKNNIKINIDQNFGERKLGDLKSLKELGKNKKFPYTTEQILDENLKNIDGESRKDSTLRFFESFNNFLNSEKDKKIAIVSHGAIIKFALLKWCNFNTTTNCIEFNSKIIAEEKISSPCIFKLEFESNKLLDINVIVVN